MKQRKPMPSDLMKTPAEVAAFLRHNAEAPGNMGSLRSSMHSAAKALEALAKPAPRNHGKWLAIYIAGLILAVGAAALLAVLFPGVPQ